MTSENLLVSLSKLLNIGIFSDVFSFYFVIKLLTGR